MTQRIKGYSLVLGTAIISGFSIFINKFGVAVINPYVFAFLKNGLVALFLCAVVFALFNKKDFKSISKIQWLLLVSIGLIGGSIPFLLFFKGLAMTSAAGASFIQKTMFVWIAIMAVVFLKEKITKKYILAGLLILCGNVLLLKLSTIKFDQGILLIFIATLFWAVENVISKYALRDMPPRLIMWGRMFFGSVFIFIFLAFSGQLAPLAKISEQQIGWTMITGVILLGYVATWYTGLKFVPVSRAALILALGSPITTLLSSFTKPVPVQETLASILILLGVIAILYKTERLESAIAHVKK